MKAAAPTRRFPIQRIRALFLITLFVLGGGSTWYSVDRAQRLAAQFGPDTLDAVPDAAIGDLASVDRTAADEERVAVSTARLAQARADLHRIARNTLLGGILRLVLGSLAIYGLTGALMFRDRRLADYASNLETMVDDRTRALEAQTRALEDQARALDQRGRGMHLVLDNVAQGLVTIDLDGVIAPERSAVVDRWLGTPAPGARLGELIGTRCAEFGIWFDLGLDGLREGAMPFEVVLAQMPGRFALGEQRFEVEYTPILDGARVERLLVLISDITARVARERAERAERELLVVFERLSHDRTGFEEFVDETTELVASLERLLDPITERRVVHTLKGNCRLYGLEGYGELCDAIEGELAEVRHHAPLSPEQRARLRAGWRDEVARMGRFLGRRDRHLVEVELPELQAAIERARRGDAGRELSAVLTSWTHERVRRRFERLGEHAQQLARRLGKAELDLAIDDGGLRLDATRWAPFWRGLVHAVRNAADHGLETEDERVVAGKPARGLLTLSAAMVPEGLRLAITDDGRGIDWDGVERRAARVGLPSATRADLEAALFSDGVTTREEVTATSGRGVGLAALRDAVLELGGLTAVESQPGAGTTLAFVFPGASARVAWRPPTQPLRRAG